MKHYGLILGVMGVIQLIGWGAGANRVLDVDTSKVVNRIDEKVYGHFLEHIYHSANGGIWGELVWNRSFENALGSHNGRWSLDEGSLVQTSLNTDIHMEFGDRGWSDYELRLQARKDSGNEAFLILVRAADTNHFYWCNLGGWGNTQHALEKEINGRRSIVGEGVPGRIESHRWYDIRIRCQGNHIQVWLDESQHREPIIDFTDTDRPYLSGAVGVGTWSTRARYRHIQVTDLNGRTLFSGQPDIAEQSFDCDNWQSSGQAVFSRVGGALNDDYCLKIDASSPRAAVSQPHFSLIEQTYSGSIWMKGKLSGGVTVSLLNQGAVLGQAQLPAPADRWQEYPFEIQSAGATAEGVLQIRLDGAGTVYLDQVSLMGEDAKAIGGYRPDLLNAINSLRPPIIRWPGGCYASAYLWKNGIGAQHDRSKYPISLWDDQDSNSYGTDEFLRMCQRINAEPLIAVNIGLLNGTCGVAIPNKLSEERYLQDVLDWMEYCNGSTDSYWGAQRAKNGHPARYMVKYWEIDNEVWSERWGGGIDHYIAKVKEFAPAMRAKAEALGVEIKLLACGSGSYNQKWNQTLITQCSELFDYISVHHYENPDHFKDGPLRYERYIEELGDLIRVSKNPEIKIYMSEWNAQSTDWRTGLYAGALLNAFERTGEVFSIGGPALFLRHVTASGWDNAFINFDNHSWFPAPNYQVMKLWHDHYGPYRVAVTGDEGELNLSAALSQDRQSLYLKVVNPNPQAETVTFRLDSTFRPQQAYTEYYASDDLRERNTLTQPDRIAIRAQDGAVQGKTVRIEVPGYSAGVTTVKADPGGTRRLLFSSFRDNGQDGLHLAWSNDGLNWHALKQDRSFLKPKVGGKLMRDPSICRGPDGKFHLVWTTGWGNKGIGLAHSEDLINWSDQTFVPVMAHEPQAMNCWAPEIFYDDATERYLIFWATTIPGRFRETEDRRNDHNHRIYYVTTKDFKSYSPTELLYDPGFNVIDAFMAKDGERYVLFVKNETKFPRVQKNIRVAYGNHAAGPYSLASGPLSPDWTEGPTAIRLGAQWLLYYDGYTRGRMEGASSVDLVHWRDITSELNFPAGTRHGTVFPVPTQVCEKLIKVQ